MKRLKRIFRFQKNPLMFTALGTCWGFYWKSCLISEEAYMNKSHLKASTPLDKKQEMKKGNLKNFEVEIKTIIVYPTFSHVELFDFECGIRDLIEDLFEEAGIKIKETKKGITELDILSIKEQNHEGSNNHSNI